MLSRLVLAAYLLAVLPVRADPVADPGADPVADKVVDAARLGRGVNAFGYDPAWSNPGAAPPSPGLFARIRAGGFAHLRLPLLAFAHMDAGNRLDPRWLDTLDTVVARARAAGLRVILDEHDHTACAGDLAACRTRLLAFWRQVAPRYRSAGAEVLFEILNEPHGAVTPDAWNALLAEALAVIRETNPGRTVVIGPAHSNGPRSLDALVLPEGDRNILVTVHFYDPFVFTHQGAPWTHPSRANDVGHTWGTAADHGAVAAAFDRIAAWGRAHGRPVHLGEFGAYDKAPMESRARWTEAVARAAEGHAMPWSYWQFDHDFALYDRSRDDWVAPIHDALVPPGR